MNQPTPASSPPPDQQTAGPHRIASRRWTTLAVIVVTVAIVGIPLLTQALPAEIARWHLAYALVAQKRGDLDLVEPSLARAERYAPHDLSVLLTRCVLMRELERYDESLAAANRALALSPHSRQVQNERGATLMRMKRFAEAAEAFEAALGPSPGSQSLNNLAYARGLAGEQLDAGLEEIERALELRQDRDSIDSAALVDTRGYLLFKQGKYQEALQDFDQAIAAFDLRRIEHLTEGYAGLRSTSDREALLESLRMSLAVMLYHRALAHEALQHTDEATADFAKVREMGYEPGEDLF